MPMKKKDIKILLVDDEPDILEIVSYNLRNEGYQIFTASNGIEAVKTAKKITPHLILLDVMMPEMDGMEACEKIRAAKGLEDVIIAFLPLAVKTILKLLVLKQEQTITLQSLSSQKY